MNILIPHSWLLEYLETPATAQEIQKYLSLAGPSVERIYQRENESVYDIEVTTNRVDSMSVKGIAREAAVILSQFGLPSHLKHVANTTESIEATAGTELPVPTITNNPDLCRRIMCVVLKNVKHTATPQWMAKRLQQIDQNVHDSVIDITNYVTHELGHPCHAFDYDKIMSLGGQIIVKEAEAGKPFITLDGVAYETVGGEIVFENEAGEIIDLPAIKGTLNTAVDDTTKNILLWIESLEPKKVRFASMSHAIRTVAAQLNEKNVDPELASEVLRRGIELYQELCDAEPASKIVDIYPGKRKVGKVTLPLSTISDYLGLTLEKDQIAEILLSLGCQVHITKGILTVTPPSLRPDIAIPADVVEEIARIYGYHRLPSKIMDTPIPLTKPENIDFKLESSIRHFLSHIGWQEVYTYSLVSEAIALESGFNLSKHLKLQNPLTDDRVYLRRSLIPSLREVILNNPLAKQVSVYELANVYHPQNKQLPNQPLMISLVSTKPYREVKGDLESLFQSLFIPAIEIKPTSDSAVKGEIVISNEGEQTVVGNIEVTPDKMTTITIPMSELLLVAKSHPQYQPIPKTAPIIEDLTFTLPKKTLVGQVLKSIKELSPMISSVSLLDIYQQNFTFTVEYRDNKRNLSSEDIEPIRKQIIDHLSATFKATLVGQV